MTEKKYNELQDDSYYDQLIKERIGQALRNHSQEEKLDLAQLEAWVEADRQRRKAKITRYVAIACCILIFCTGMFSIKYMFNSDDTMVIAGKNDDKVHESGNNAVVKPGDGDGEENTGVKTITCDSWEAVEEARKTYPEMLIPKYIPNEYKFEVLDIEISEVDVKFIFSFFNNVKKLEITQIIGASASVIRNFNRKIMIEGEPLLIKEQDGKCGFYQKNNYTFYVLTDCSDNEIVKIIENMD